MLTSYTCLQSDKLQIANRMFVADNFKIKDAFLSDAQNYFNSGIDNVDFRSPEAVTAINSYVAQKTHNKITSLFSQCKSLLLQLISSIVRYNKRIII